MPVSSEARAAQAWRALEACHYRDAMIHFRALLKSEDSEALKAGLAAAYQGRARELAAKGMLKEALVIWDNRTGFCPGAPPDPQHFGALVRAGRAMDAARSFRRLERTLDKQTLSGLRCQFAALYIGGGAGFEQELADDDPIIVHGASARAALAAWFDGDHAASAEALANIPFRSPYRDWVHLLKALMKLPADAAGAKVLLQRIPPDSAFAPLARAAGLALLSDSEFDAALLQAGEMSRRFAAVLRGWTETRLKLWSELKPSGDRIPAGGLEKIIGRHSSVLDETWIQHYGLRLLMNRHPQRRNRSSLLREKGLTSFQRHLVEAWHAEEARDPWDIYRAWQGVILQLRQPSDPAPGSDDALRIALIQRRLETQWKLLDYPDDPWDTESLSQRVLEQFEESLRFDPDDKPTSIRLIAHFRDNKALKQARRVLEQALACWPDDVEVLGEAMETAVTGGAYKKAAGYARRVLALDPINSKVIGSLLEMHLSHTRKQLGKGRIDLAEQELQAAAEWVRGEKAAAKLDILRGILLFDSDKQAGTAVLRAVVERLGGLTGQLALVLEIALLDRAPGTFTKALGLAAIRRPEKVDFLRFLRELRETLDTGAQLTRQVPVYFESALKRAAGLDLTLQESEVVCETLHRCDLSRARLAHARAALKHWPGQPVFELHAFEARHQNTHSPATDKELGRLENAWERARGAGDMRTANRIGDTLQQYLAPPPGLRLPEQPPEGFRELVDEVGIEGVMEAFEAIMGGAIPEGIFTDDGVDPFSPPGEKPGKKRRRKPRPDDPDDQIGLFE